MGLYQSYQQVFVTNSPALLAEGKTVDNLAVGQVAILDAKTHKATLAPTYAKNKALKFAWGTPNVNLGDFGGAPNENEYTKVIKGKAITRVRSAKAKKGVTPLYSLGWSGDVSDTDTLQVLPGESKQIYVKLTGTIINRLYSNQGFIKVFKSEVPCVAKCADDLCTPDANHQIKVAKDFARQINQDKDLRRFIGAKTNIFITGGTSPTETTCYKFKLAVCDTGDERSLGIVQAQYVDDKVVISGRADSITTYSITRNANTTPTAFSSAPVYVPVCGSCVSGYTYSAPAKTFHVRTLASVTSGNVATAFTGEVTISLVNTDPQFKTYAVTFATTVDNDTVIAAAVTAGYTAYFVGIEQPLCTLTTPVTTAWAADGTLKKQSKSYRITLGDNVPCGTNRLADLQAAYPALTISVVDSAGSCVHTYETSTVSDCYEVGCGSSDIVWHKPDPFEGSSWTEVADALIDPTTVVKTGLLFETAFYNRVTNDCSFDAFPYENDVVHIEVNEYDPNYNGDPCTTNWKFKQLRQVQYPQGHGQYIRKLEENSKMYDHRYRAFDPIMRENDHYTLQADPNKFYDQYVVEFSTKFRSAGWGEQYTETWHLHIFVPEGTGGQLEAALNSYVTSAGLEEEGTVI